MSNLVSLTRPSLQILNKNCHNFKTINDIDITLWPVTKVDKKKTKRWRQKNDDDVLSASYAIIVIVPIYGWFGEIQSLDCGRIVSYF